MKGDRRQPPWPIRENVARIFDAVLDKRLAERLPSLSSIDDAIFFIDIARRRNDVEGFIAGLKILTDHFPSLPGRSFGLPPPTMTLRPEDRRAIEDFMNPPRRSRGRPRAGTSTKRKGDTDATADANREFMFNIALEVVRRCAAEGRKAAGLERLADSLMEMIVVAVADEVKEFNGITLDSAAIFKRIKRK